MFQTAINAYSFNKLLNDAIKGRTEGTTLVKVLEFAANIQCEGFDPTGYFFPGYPAVPSDAYVDHFKRRAAELGVGISGTGVRNNFTTSDQAVRKSGVKHIEEWVEVAARLGAPVIRVFADTQMRNETWESVAKGFTREQVQEWIAAGLRECADHGKRYTGDSGYLPIETLAPKRKPYDPYVVVPEFLDRLQAAIAQTA